MLGKQCWPVSLGLNWNWAVHFCVFSIGDSFKSTTPKNLKLGPFLRTCIGAYSNGRN